MKKIFIPSLILLAFILVKCNSEVKTENEDNQIVETIVDLGNVDEIDMEEHGFQIFIKVPAAGPAIPKPTIDVLDWGAAEVRVGNNFQIQISASEGNISQKKEDINLDDIYETEFIIDEDYALFYSSKVRGTDLEPEYHFYVIISDGTKAYETEDIKGDVFSKKVAERMFNLAKAIKIKPTI